MLLISYKLLLILLLLLYALLPSTHLFRWANTAYKA